MDTAKSPERKMSVIETSVKERTSKDIYCYQIYLKTNIKETGEYCVISTELLLWQYAVLEFRYNPIIRANNL